MCCQASPADHLRDERSILSLPFGLGPQTILTVPWSSPLRCGQITGFSPLGSSSYVQLGMDQGQGVGVLSNPVVVELAAKYKRTPAQVVLRWVRRGFLRLGHGITSDMFQ